MDDQNPNALTTTHLLPAMLHYAVTQDYAARWADLTPPTLEECVAFCAAVVLPVEPEPIE